MEGVEQNSVAALESASLLHRGKGGLFASVRLINHLVQDFLHRVDLLLGKTDSTADGVRSLLLRKQATEFRDVPAKGGGNVHWRHATVRVHLSHEALLIRAHTRWLLGLLVQYG
jgi:hypothetical protein